MNAVAAHKLSKTGFRNYYALHASVAFSLGSHDEWNISHILNERRRPINSALAIRSPSCSMAMASPWAISRAQWRIAMWGAATGGFRTLPASFSLLLDDCFRVSGLVQVFHFWADGFLGCRQRQNGAT